MEEDLCLSFSALLPLLSGGSVMQAFACMSVVTVYAFLCAYLPAHGTRLLRLSATLVISLPHRPPPTLPPI